MSNKLGAPLDALTISLCVVNPLGQKGYTFLLYGTYQPETPGSENAPIFKLYLFGDTVKAIPLVPWVQLIRCPEKLGIKAEWSPANGEKISALGLEHLLPTQAGKAVQEGMKLLRGITQRGRPKGPGRKAYTKEEFDEHVAAAYKTLFETSPGCRVTAGALALVIKRYDERQLCRYIDNFHGMTWTQFREMVLPSLTHS